MSRLRRLQIARASALPALAVLASFSLLAGSAAAAGLPTADQHDEATAQEQLDGSGEDPAFDSGEAADPKTDASLEEAPEPGESDVEAGAADPSSANNAVLQSASGCSYADPGTGSHAESLCWFDFTGFNFNGSGTVEENIEIDLGSGRTLIATLKVSGGAVAAHKFPTWSGAFLGNGVYSGVAGQPALYHSAAGNASQTELSLTDIQIIDANQTPLTGFSIVVADAESTDASEWIEWETDAGDFTLLPNTPSSDFGNACSGGFQISGGAATCTGGSTAGNKTGTAMLYVDAPSSGRPFEVAQTMQGGGLQGVAFAVMFATSRAEIEVEDRINGTGDLAVEMNADQLPDPVIATIPGAGSATNADTGVQELLVPAGQPVEIGFEAAGGNLFDSYAQRWVCERTDPDSPDDPWQYEGQEPPQPAESLLGAGEAISCTVTLTPPYLTLEKNLEDEYSGLDLGPEAWLLSAAGPTDVAPQPGSTVRQPVAIGEYELVEQADASTAGTAGFELVGWECVDATGAAQVEEGTVIIGPGTDATCTATNRALPAAVAWSKVDAEDTGALLAGSAWTLVGPGDGQDAEEIVVVDCESGPCEGADEDPEAGSFLVDNLRWGTYTLTETTAPDGYAGEEQREFTLNGETAHDGLTLSPIENDRVLGSVTWTKVDASDPEHLLAGSEWALTGPAGAETVVLDCIEEPCTGPDQNPAAGEFQVDGLGWGTYALTETKAPPGYLVGAEETFEIGPDSGAEARLEWELGAFENEQQAPIALPLTGGASSSTFWIIGSGLLGGAALFGAVMFGRRRLM